MRGRPSFVRAGEMRVRATSMPSAEVPDMTPATMSDLDLGDGVIGVVRTVEVPTHGAVRPRHQWAARLIG